jgi:phosphatidylethanolamine/phosphatidyl-N-methylethanolamine N-methyltransferase
MTAQTLKSHLDFFWAGLLKHGQTGGIMPSQRFLIAQMIAPVPTSYQGQILELGAGTGALTLRLAAKCPQARVLACEINPTLAQDSRAALARAGHNGRVRVVAQSAGQLLAELGEGGVEQPDFILSGIPLANLGAAKARTLIATIHRTLGEQGIFIQFQHSLLDRKLIRAEFPYLRTVPVFLNFPPAVVYYARNQPRVRP